jgi:hypothetical protein
MDAQPADDDPEASVMGEPGRPALGRTTGSDPLVAALARLVAGLDRRYQGGRRELPTRGLAIDADRANMPTVTEPKRPPAA